MTTSRLYTGAARAIDAIPVVGTTAQRDARYPDHPLNFRVQNLETGSVQRYTGSGWVDDWELASTSTRWFNVLNYGALGTGGDDSAGIQAAVDAAEVGGGVVYFPTVNNSGTVAIYGIGTTITVSSKYPVILLSYMQVQGGDIDGSMPYLKPVSGLTNYMIEYKTGTANRYDGGGGQVIGLSFYDPAERGGSAVSCTALRLRDFMGGKIINCHFHYIKGTAVDIHAAVQGSMVGCAVRYCGDTGAPAVIAGSRDDTTYAVQAFNIEDCRLEVNYSAAYLSMPFGIANTLNGSNKVIGCQFEADTNIAATSQVYIDTDQVKNQIIGCGFNRNDGQLLNVGSNGTDSIIANIVADTDTADGTTRFRFQAQRLTISTIRSRGNIANATGLELSVEQSLCKLTDITVTSGAPISITGALCAVSNLFQYQCKATTGYAVVATGTGMLLSGVHVHTTNVGCKPLSVASTGVTMSGIKITNTGGTGSVIVLDEGYSQTQGDADVTLTCFSNVPVQRFTSALTANRTVTLSTTDAYHGAHFRIVRTGLGAFTLDVGGLKTIGSATAAFVDVIYNGSAWVLAGYGTL